MSDPLAPHASPTELGGGVADGYAEGNGDALLAVGLAVVGSRGCDLAVLMALPDDRPHEWYSRRGFARVATAWEALRSPERTT